MSVLYDVRVTWKTFVVILTPLIALPILFIDGSRAMACLYGIVIIAVFWTTEALPIPVTGLLPLVLFSALGVLPARVLAANYAKEATMFGISCLSFALCVERWNLHRRIALSCLLLFGSSPKWLMLGFMVPSWFLSMFISNTSTTAMMIPVASAVLTNLKDINEAMQKHSAEDSTISSAKTQALNSTAVNMNHRTKEKLQLHDERQYKSFCKALNLCVCYSATIGGIGSLMGTGPNIIMQGQADELFSEYSLDSGVNYLTWMLCCLPMSAICLVVAWVWLVIYFLGLRDLLTCSKGTDQEQKKIRDVIRGFLKELGPFSFAEKSVIGFFILLLSLWLTIKIPGGGGWGTLFKPGFVGNSTAGIPFLALLTIFPSEINWKRRKSKSKYLIPPLLDWKTIQTKYPWNFLLLLSGGYCIASTCQQSGLSEWIASQLLSLTQIEPWLCVLVLSIAISFMTELTSNSATASILFPILAQMAIAVKANPLLFMFPGALSCSLAFMFPVATPPNAIAFASGHLRIIDMIKAGFILNFLCVAIVNMGINLWGKSIFDLDTLPLEMMLKLGQNTTSFSNASSEIN